MGVTRSRLCFATRWTGTPTPTLTPSAICRCLRIFISGALENCCNLSVAMHVHGTPATLNTAGGVTATMTPSALSWRAWKGTSSATPSMRRSVHYVLTSRCTTRYSTSPDTNTSHPDARATPDPASHGRNCNNRLHGRIGVFPKSMGLLRRLNARRTPASPFKPRKRATDAPSFMRLCGANALPSGINTGPIATTSTHSKDRRTTRTCSFARNTIFYKVLQGRPPGDTLPVVGCHHPRPQI